MSLQKDLELRADVPDKDIAEIIATAHRLQRKAEDASHDLTVEDLGNIAEDLDIDRKFVEQAITLHKEAREGAAAAERRAREKRRRLTVVGGAVLAALAVLLVVLALVGARSISQHEEQVKMARGQVDQVLERFALSAPLGLALVGADSVELRPALANFEQASDTATRIAAGKQLNQAIAEALANLPETTDRNAGQNRLNLHYELTGFQNRITTEAERLRAAEAEYRADSESLTGRLAKLFGMGN